MNLELNVVRFENEDVIATSCDVNAKHYYVIEEGFGAEFEYKNDIMQMSNYGFVSVPKDLKQGKLIYADEGEGYNGIITGMYYLNGDKFVPCSEAHEANFGG